MLKGLVIALAGVLGLALGAVGWGAGRAPAKSHALAAALSARSEVPAPKGAAAASGRFTGTLTVTGTKGKLAWRLTFSKLSGPAVAAHVHVGNVGVPGPVAIALCGPCKSGAKGVWRGNVKSGLLKDIVRRGTYVNVHTAKNAKGEIRGQIKATPTSPPATGTTGDTGGDTGTTGTTGTTYTDTY